MMVMRKMVWCVLLTGVVGFGCDSENDDGAAPREGEAIAEEMNEVYNDVGVCLADLQACFDAAVMPEDLAACANQAQACLPAGVVPDIPDIPDIPELPPIPDPGDLGAGCAADLEACILADPLGADACTAAFEACLQQDLQPVCDAVHQFCVDAGAPPAVCDAVANNC